jgi:1,4-alpha-glucan branching enzyme
MGNEFAQFDEWKDLTELDWGLLDFDSHDKFQHYFTSLNQYYQETSCLWRIDNEIDGFEWIDPHNNEQSIIVFIRRGKRKGDYCIVVCNFSACVHHQFRIGVPSHGSYLEVFNSDAVAFGGSGQCNVEPISSKKQPYHNQRCSMEITVPPLGVSIFMKQTKNRRRENFHYGI